MHVETIHAGRVSVMAILVLLMLAGGLLAVFLKSPRRAGKILGLGVLGLVLLVVVARSMRSSVEQARMAATEVLQDQARVVQEQSRALQHQAEAISEEQSRDLLQAQEDYLTHYERSQEFYRQQSRQQQESISMRPVAPSLAAGSMSPEILSGWQSEADIGFHADVYPSVRSAAESLAVQVVSEIARLTTPERGVERVELYGHEIEADVLAAVQKRLQGRDLQVEILQAYVVSDGSPADDDRPEEVIARLEGVKTVRLDILSSSSRSTELVHDERSGTLRVRVRGNDLRFDRTARFVEKPWVADHSAFVSKGLPGQQAFLIGYSAPSAATRQEAEEAALRAAAVQLVPLVRHWAMRTPSAQPVLQVSDVQLRDWVSQQLQAGEGIADRFVQSFDRPYGRVWREAVLVETAPTRIASLASGCLTRQKFDWASRVHPVFHVAALAVLICIVYLFLNAVTKGYYTRTLMGTSVVALALGVLVLLRLG